MQNKDYPRLLNCPFCGGKAKIIINRSSQSQMSNVQCTECRCKKILIKSIFYKGDIEQDAINDWNRRAENA